MNIKYILIIALFSIVELFSQAGMKFPELSKRLESYFDEELIEDVKKQLPQGSDYSIWGWDVGDFSGDGYNDVAFAVKLNAEKRKIVQVYLFVDIDGYLTPVGQFPYEYFELPLEIGVVIRDTNCYVTRKRKQFDWTIRGYRFDNGCLVLYNDFNTKKIEKFTMEENKNYHTLLNNDKFLDPKNEKVEFTINYLTIPSYQRGRVVYKGYQSTAFTNYVDYAIKGAYYWKGDVDASYSVSSAYDDEYLYMTVKVRDDKVVSQNCNKCLGDYVELWFDLTSQNSNDERVKVIDDKLVFRDKIDAGIYNFKVYPGDFVDKRAYFSEVSSTDNMDFKQKQAIPKMRASSSLQMDGYTLKFKIPFEVLGFMSLPSEEKNIDFGCTVILHDIDNEYRPEEETLIATSAFDQNNPSTYGTLSIISNNNWYGESYNVFKEDIIRCLNDLGF